MNTFLKELECPICLELMVGKISLCNNGHNMCKKCKENLLELKCPVCKGYFINGRNYALENVANLTVQCKREGCSKKLQANLIWNSTHKCTFKKVQCPLPVNRCEWKGNFLSIKNHVIAQHNNDIGKWLVDDSNNKYFYFYLFYHRDLFIAHYKLEGSEYLCAVMKMGFNNRFSADHFTFNYEVGGSGYKAKFAAPCIPRCPQDHVFRSEYVTVSQNMIDKITKNGIYYTKVTLANALYPKRKH